MCVCGFSFFANMIYSNAIFSSVFYQQIIFFYEIKTPAGASSEHLMSDSLSHSFKRFVQTANSSDVYAWANETLTQPIRSKH